MGDKNTIQSQQRNQSSNLFFLLLLFFEIAILFFLIAQKRIPIGHDGFYHFCMQYFFLNNSAVNNEIPLWVPYMSHGTTATWWYTIQGAIGLLGNALLLLGSNIAKINFLEIFHLDILVYRLMLLVGVWLLSGRYFTSSWTRFFVCTCVMASTVTMTQFGFTLRMLYAIPLMIYLFHYFFDSSRWRYFFLACNLFCIQMVGNEAYFLPIISLTLFLYFFFWILDQPSAFIQQIRNLRWGPQSFVAILGVILSFILLFVLFKMGNDPWLLNLKTGRNPDGSVPLEVFLTYATASDLGKWGELFLRLSPCMDYTIYIGFLALPFILIGALFSRNKMRNPLLLLILTLLLISIGSFVASFFYYVWPTMKLYRHLSLIAPLIKLFLIFLAGLGFEEVLNNDRIKQKNKFLSWACFLAGAGFLCLSLFLFVMGSHETGVTGWIVYLIERTLPKFMELGMPGAISTRLLNVYLFPMMLGCIFIVLPLISIENKKRNILFLMLFIHTLDVYGYHFIENHNRTFSLSKAQYDTTAFTKTPFYPKRFDALGNNPREIILTASIKHYTLYPMTNAFLLGDHSNMGYEEYQMLKPLDTLTTTLRKNESAFRKISGFEEDKIQFFKKAYLVNDENRIVDYIRDKKFAGDVLFVSGNKNDMVADLEGNDRAHIPYKIEKFTANTLEMTTEVPLNEPIWMMYADVWHPGWHAQINNKPVEIFKADLAYKAVQLMPGKNTIRFTFSAPMVSFLQQTMIVQSVAWLFILLFLIIRILRPRKIVTGTINFIN